MWINKKAYKAWVESVNANRTQLEDYIAQAYEGKGWMEREIAGLKKKLEDKEAALAYFSTKLADAEGRLKASRAYSDTWRLQLNHLQLERADLMARLLPGYAVKVPQIELQAEFLPPGLDFEDLGDERAAHFGYAPEHPIEGQPANVPQRPRPEDGYERMDEPTPLADPQEH